MIYTEQTIKAINLMFEKHKNQFDKSGVPYVFHPWNVAQNQENEICTIVALLHDVIEDTNTTIEELIKLGFDDKVIESVKLLTHDKKIDYFEYIKKVNENPIARSVKLEDLKQNSNINRLTKITKKDIDRIKKYKRSIELLEKTK